MKLITRALAAVPAVGVVIWLGITERLERARMGTNGGSLPPPSEGSAA